MKLVVSLVRYSANHSVPIAAVVDDDSSDKDGLLYCMMSGVEAHEIKEGQIINGHSVHFKSRRPDKQFDEKQPLQFIEDYLTGLVQRGCRVVPKALGQNDFAKAASERSKLKVYVKLLNWLKERGYVKRWAKQSPGEVLRTMLEKHIV
jgi:hypothetical protein